MKNFKRKQYKDFITSHILRPYQTKILEGQEQAVDFTETLYRRVPEFLENVLWRQMVFDRLSAIVGDGFIEADLFPDGTTKNHLLYWMYEYDIRVKWE